MKGLLSIPRDPAGPHVEISLGTFKPTCGGSNLIRTTFAILTCQHSRQSIPYVDKGTLILHTPI